MKPLKRGRGRKRTFCRPLLALQSGKNVYPSKHKECKIFATNSLSVKHAGSSKRIGKVYHDKKLCVQSSFSQMTANHNICKTNGWTGDGGRCLRIRSQTEEVAGKHTNIPTKLLRRRFINVRPSRVFLPKIGKGRRHTSRIKYEWRNGTPQPKLARRTAPHRAIYHPFG